MIRFQPITTSDVQHYKFMEELLVDSFRKNTANWSIFVNTQTG